VPFGVLFVQAILVLLGVAGVRAAARVLVYLRTAQAGEGARVLIVGAGSAGSLLLREITGRPQLGLTPSASSTTIPGSRDARSGGSG
jgi:FlaA1/EpsC-like NDP-sugar epimerase